MSPRGLDEEIAGVRCGHGPERPDCASRTAAQWLPGRQGRAPVLLCALIRVEGCAAPVRLAQQLLNELFADYPCTPSSWSEAQVLRQQLALLNQRLFHGQAPGAREVRVDIGLLLFLEQDLLFFQVGEVGLLRCQAGGLQLHGAVGESALGRHPELTVVQRSLPREEAELLVLGVQSVLAHADLAGLRVAELTRDEATQARWFAALPGAALQVRSAALGCPAPMAMCWPTLSGLHPGQSIDGWTVLGACEYGPAGRLYLVEDEDARKALLCLAAQPADDALWQREWALRRSPARGLPAVLSSRLPRTHAYWLWALPGPGMRPLDAWRGPGRLAGTQLLELLDQLIECLRALQRRGMRGLWLAPTQILRNPQGALCVLAEGAVSLPGELHVAAPVDWLPLAPELRRGEVDGSRAEQFLVAACAYWLLSGRWPVCAMPGGEGSCHDPLAGRIAGLPAGWEGVLARALAPRPEARYAALSEFRQALEAALEDGEQARREESLPIWTGVALVFVALQLCLGLWFGLSA